MKWSKNEIFQHADQTIEFEESLSFDSTSFEKIDRIYSIKDVLVKGELNYSSQQDRLLVKVEITGTYIVPCAITLEPVATPCFIEADEWFSLKTDDSLEDAIYIASDVVNLTEWILQLLIIEAPLKVVKSDLTSYPKGKGWEVIKESEYDSRKTLDPRLAKFKDFKPE